MSKCKMFNLKKLAHLMGISYDRMKNYHRDGMPMPGGLSTLEAAANWIVNRPLNYKPYSKQSLARRKRNAR